MNRRDLLKTAAAGMLASWVAPASARQAAGPRRLTATLTVLDAGGANVLVLSAPGRVVLVDTGAPASSARLLGELSNLAVSTVHTVFNTHHHLDQTGNNEIFAAGGARIVAHARASQWMSVDTWIPAEDRYEKARPRAARPTETFLTTGSMTAGSEQIDYGYLPLAHTSGDIYVFFATSNVLAAGDVVSPLRDPAFDYFTGGWIGGRVDAMDALLKISNEQTRIVPAYGPVMTRAELKAERDMMEEVRARLFTRVREGDDPKDMLQAGVLNGLRRTWTDPEAFLYAAAKGLWAHHNKLDPNVV